VDEEEEPGVWLVEEEEEEEEEELRVALVGALVVGAVVGPVLLVPFPLGTGVVGPVGAAVVGPVGAAVVGPVGAVVVGAAVVGIGVVGNVILVGKHVNCRKACEVLAQSEPTAPIAFPAAEGAPI
jgi:hypothetical protein